MTRKSTTQPETKKEDVSVNDALIQELLNKVKELESKLEEKNDDNSNGFVPVDDVDIRPDEYIKIMSMLSWPLNLSTRDSKQPFKFKKLFDTKRILYKDLVEIMEQHPTFTEYGYFYILDPRVVRKHGLDDIYENILNDEKMKKVLDGGVDVAYPIFASANPKQKKVIVQLVINKIANDEDVDKNLVYKMSEDTGINILEKAKETKELSIPQSKK